jgi:ATP-dependent Clp protease ATP-binding subunit ClpA
VEVTPAAKQWLLERAGLDPSTGARPLRRTLQRHLQDTISEVLIRSDGVDIEAFDADVEGGELVLRSRLRELEPSRT